MGDVVGAFVGVDGFGCCGVSGCYVLFGVWLMCEFVVGAGALGVSVGTEVWHVVQGVVVLCVAGVSLVHVGRNAWAMLGVW